MSFPSDVTMTTELEDPPAPPDPSVNSQSTSRTTESETSASGSQKTIRGHPGSASPALPSPSSSTFAAVSHPGFGAFANSAQRSKTSLRGDEQWSSGEGDGVDSRRASGAFSDISLSFFDNAYAGPTGRTPKGSTAGVSGAGPSRLRNEVDNRPFLPPAPFPTASSCPATVPPFSVGRRISGTSHPASHKKDEHASQPTHSPFPPIPSSPAIHHDRPPNDYQFPETPASHYDSFSQTRETLENDEPWSVGPDPIRPGSSLGQRFSRDRLQQDLQYETRSTVSSVPSTTVNRRDTFSRRTPAFTTFSNNQLSTATDLTRPASRVDYGKRLSAFPPLQHQHPTPAGLGSPVQQISNFSSPATNHSVERFDPSQSRSHLPYSSGESSSPTCDRPSPDVVPVDEGTSHQQYYQRPHGEPSYHHPFNATPSQPYFPHDLDARNGVPWGNGVDSRTVSGTGSIIDHGEHNSMDEEEEAMELERQQLDIELKRKDLELRKRARQLRQQRQLRSSAPPSSSNSLARSAPPSSSSLARSHGKRESDAMLSASTFSGPPRATDWTDRSLGHPGVQGNRSSLNESTKRRKIDSSEHLPHSPAVTIPPSHTSQPTSTRRLVHLSPYGHRSPASQVSSDGRVMIRHRNDGREVCLPIYNHPSEREGYQALPSPEQPPSNNDFVNPTQPHSNDDTPRNNGRHTSEGDGTFRRMQDSGRQQLARRLEYGQGPTDTPAFPRNHPRSAPVRRESQTSRNAVAWRFPGESGSITRDGPGGGYRVSSVPGSCDNNVQNGAPQSGRHPSNPRKREFSGHQRQPGPSYKSGNAQESVRIKSPSPKLSVVSPDWRHSNAGWNPDGYRNDPHKNTVHHQRRLSESSNPETVIDHEEEKPDGSINIDSDDCFINEDLHRSASRPRKKKASKKSAAGGSSSVPLAPSEELPGKYVPPKNDPDHVKRPWNKYFCWKHDFIKSGKAQKTFTKQYLTENGYNDQAELMRLLGPYWRKYVPESEKKYWADVARKKKEEHERMHPGYQFKPHRSSQPSKKPKSKTQQSHPLDSSTSSMVVGPSRSGGETDLSAVESEVDNLSAPMVGNNQHSAPVNGSFDIPVSTQPPMLQPAEAQPSFFPREDLFRSMDSTKPNEKTWMENSEATQANNNSFLNPSLPGLFDDFSPWLNSNTMPAPMNSGLFGSTLLGEPDYNTFLPDFQRQDNPTDFFTSNSLNPDPSLLSPVASRFESRIQEGSTLTPRLESASLNNPGDQRPIDDFTRFLET